MRGRLVVNVLAGVLGLLAAAVLSFFIAVERNPEPAAATVLPEPVALPDFRLQTGDGRAFTRESFEGAHHLLFFGFTNCPDICPITLQQLAAARRQLDAAAVDPLPEIVFVSVDPERDSADSVRDYAAAFGEGVTGVRGDLAEIDRLTDALGIFHARPTTADGYDVEHSGAVLVIDDRARFSAVFGAPHEIEDFVRDWPIVSRGS